MPNGPGSFRRAGIIALSEPKEYEVYTCSDFSF